jgi:hypothetical protein
MRIEYYEGNLQKHFKTVYIHYKFTSYEELVRTKIYNNNSLEIEFVYITRFRNNNKVKVRFKITALVAILSKIQNGGGARLSS